MMANRRSGTDRSVLVQRPAFSKGQLPLFCASLLAVALATPGAWAVDRVWTGAFDGISFGNPGNWSPAGVPGAADGALFQSGLSNVLMPGGLVVNNRLFVGGSGTGLTLDLASGLYRLTRLGSLGLDRSLVVGGTTGSGALALENGTLVIQHGVIGLGARSTGLLEVGSGAELQALQSVVIGEGGAAAVAVAGNATVGPTTLAQNLASSGELTVAGMSALWLTLGDFNTGFGNAAIATVDGALVLVTGDVNLAKGSGRGSAASLEVADLGSTWLVDGALNVGGSSSSAGGPADVLVADEALLRAGTDLRLWAGSTFSVSNARADANLLEILGGTFELDALSTAVIGPVGDSEDAGLLSGLTDDGSSIAVSEGGLLKVVNASFGPTPGGVFTGTLEGTDTSAWFQGNLALGWPATPGFARTGGASLAVLDGASLVSDGTVEVRQGGRLVLDGGTVETADFVVTDDGTVLGTFAFSDGPALVKATSGATLGGGLLVDRTDPQDLPPLGAIYRAVEAPLVDGQFSVIMTRPLPALRRLRPSGTGVGPAGVILEVETLPALVNLGALSPIDLPGAPNKIVAGKFNPNIKPDLFVTIPNGDPDEPGDGILLVNATGVAGSDAFVIAGSIPLGLEPSGVSAGDMNGNNVPDFVISNEGDGTIRIIINQSTADGPALVEGTILEVGGRPSGVSVARVRGSARNDVIWTDRDAGTVNVNESNEDGTYGKTQSATAGTQPSSVCPIDLDNDKDLDLAVLNTGAGAAFGPITGSSVTIHKNLLTDGGEFFAGAVAYEVGAGAVGLAEGDLNGDGAVDFVTANSIAGTISVLIGRGDGTLHAAVDLPAGGFPTALAIGDFDNDSDEDLDIAVLVNDEKDEKGQPRLTIFRNDSAGGQTVLAIIENAQLLLGLPVALTSTDTDNDGPADLVFVGGGDDGEGFVSVIEGNPIVCIGDIDGDAAIDGTDLGILLVNFGLTGVPGDLDDDGVIDQTDLGILLSNWGACDLGGK